MYEALISILGEVPHGLEPVIYCLSAVLVVWLISNFFTILYAIFFPFSRK